ncbi:MAG: ABC transporter ATP-binding protein/permease [Corallococcus sp.]|nr:ABC transporter ATP-binding protein/permease [Corallococcus sp.]MCM1358971.1 ABC transporter ATP-binding protein/permease [Corallococcus sp.]MCM1394960.1 ABC transporter ATP-binding protein/permease [Corallococcus sp.]
MPRNKGLGAPRPKNIKGTLGRLLAYLKPYKGRMVAVFICIVASSFANVFATSLLSPLLNGLSAHAGDDVTLTGITVLDDLAFNPATKIQYLLWMVGIIAVIYVVGMLANYISNRILVGISTSTMTKMRNDLFSHMQQLPIKVFDTTTHGELMTRYTNDIDMMNEFVARCLPQMVSSFITIITVFTMMFVLSWELSLVMIGMLLLMLLLVKILGGKSKTNFVAQQTAVGKLNGYIEEMTEGQKVVKAFNHEEIAKAEFDEINRHWQTVSARANSYANVMGPIMNNLSHFFYAGIAIIGALIAISPSTANPLAYVGIIAVFLMYIRNITNPIQQIAQQINLVFMAVAGGERVFALMDTPVEVDDGYVTLVNAAVDEKGNITESAVRTGRWAWKHPHQETGEITYTELKGDVRFEDVTFGYEEDKTVLYDVSLYAEPGQKIAFVGSTGAGKTTITNLINRFYDVPDGKIRYDGININKIKKSDLRRSLAMVLQDTHLFTGTVLDNIRYGRLDATDEECIAAAKSANAHQFIKHLPDGYNTMLTRDGENLSQGQRQLLAIARAAVADPPVLILDEATSSIDTRTEWLIEKGMDALMEGRTTFVIAHRLSTVRNSDAIMVLEHGKIIERGSHDDLIEQKGKYYQLYTGMFELS